MSKPIDILGLGCVAVDTFLFIDSFPTPDSKVRIQQQIRDIGGQTGTALIAASRLGANCAYVGVLGEGDEVCDFVRTRLHKDSVSFTHAKTSADAQPIRTTVLVDTSKQTRTILYDLNGASPTPEDWPSEDVIRSSKLLFVDHFGAEAMLRAARIARSANIPIVADFEAGDSDTFRELFAMTDHLILSRTFAELQSGCHSPEQAVRALWNEHRQVVVVTCGEDGCWFVDKNDPQTPQHMLAFSVNAVDTTGCGDVFHGAYAFALLQGWGVVERVRFASAAAALQTTRPGGASAAPRFNEIQELLSTSSDC